VWHAFDQDAPRSPAGKLRADRQRQWRGCQRGASDRCRHPTTSVPVRLVWLACRRVSQLCACVCACEWLPADLSHVGAYRAQGQARAEARRDRALASYRTTLIVGGGGAFRADRSGATSLQEPKARSAECLPAAVGCRLPGAPFGQPLGIRGAAFGSLYPPESGAGRPWLYFVCRQMRAFQWVSVRVFISFQAMHCQVYVLFLHYLHPFANQP
jgi:hypothetical protein